MQRRPFCARCCGCSRETCRRMSRSPVCSSGAARTIGKRRSTTCAVRSTKNPTTAMLTLSWRTCSSCADSRKKPKPRLRASWPTTRRTKRHGAFSISFRPDSTPRETAPPTDTSRDVFQGAGAVDNSTVASALREVLRRGELATEFSRARFANGSAVQTPRIRRESRVGDSLAGFYSQWLELDDTPACPPNAWAWNACQHWQRAAAPEDWQSLAERFPEAATETEFLRSLACPAAAEGEDWHRHNTDKGATGRAVDILMHELAETWEHPDHNATQHERDDAACALMACAAADTLEFAVGQDCAYEQRGMLGW